MNKKNWSEFPEMPEEKESQWDARQLYVKTLHYWSVTANILKMRIEQREGNVDEIMENFKLYFSILRAMYRELRFFFNEDEQKKIDEKIERIKKMMVELLQQTQGNLIPKKRLLIPKNLEDDLEKLQNIINQKRFDMKLVVPISMPERDETGIAGWDDF